MARQGFSLLTRYPQRRLIDMTTTGAPAIGGSLRRLFSRHSR